MKKTFILIGHKKQHGKDTFAKMLKKHLVDAEILSFADPMREILADMKGLSVEEYKELYTTDEQEREEIKRFGSNKMIEYFGETVWRDVLLRRADKLDCRFIIVPDFRFYREEIEGAITINVHNPRVHSNDLHPSEKQLEGYKWQNLIFNDDSLGMLETKAYYFARTLLKELDNGFKRVPVEEVNKAEAFTKSVEEHLSEINTENYMEDMLEKYIRGVSPVPPTIKLLILSDFICTEGKVFLQGESYEG